MVRNVLPPLISPKVERSGNITIITFVADAIRDVENVIARELEGLTTGTSARHLLLDFSHAVYLNSIELGTRMALGALDRELVGTVVGGGLKLAGLGIALGAVAAFAIRPALPVPPPVLRVMRPIIRVMSTPPSTREEAWTQSTTAATMPSGRTGLASGATATSMTTRTRGSVVTTASLGPIIPTTTGHRTPIDPPRITTTSSLPLQAPTTTDSLPDPSVTTAGQDVTSTTEGEQ